MSTSSSTNKQRQQGAAMVEMAILFTLLVILFLGVTELGRALFFQQKLAKAAESAARYMGRAWEAVDPATCAEGAGWDAGMTSAANLAVFGSAAGGGTAAIPNFEPASVTATVEARDVDDVGSVCVVHVDISVEYDGLFFGGGGGFLPPIILGGAGDGGWTLTASSEERYVGE